MNWETRKEPTNQDNTATGTPTSNARPMLPPITSAAATGPGCGGTSACIAAKAPAVGNAYKIREPPNRRATVMMIGRNTTSPASKKIGKPNNSAATPMASGARFSPNRPIRVSARTCAPPVISRSRPIMTPKPTRRATDPRVLENP